MIDFKLPDELIAQEPARPRDSARLLVYNRSTKEITDTVFSEVEKYLNPDTTLVVNNSKVDQCRLLFGKIEIFILEKLDDHRVRAMVRPGKKFKLDSQVVLADWLTVKVTAIDDDGLRTLEFSVPHDDERLKQYEHIPLPPYIEQNDELADEYQTVYADPSGSKAAPTAGLHFTDSLLDSIRSRHDYVEVTLHVGLGTFASLTDDNFESGTLHSERYSIDSKSADLLNRASHITAVGTTSTRTLESALCDADVFTERSGSTDIFIQPGYEYKAVDSLITNFHLPGTSLLLMVEAFLDSEVELQRIYDHAIAEKYRFYSFGDAMLIL